jgi:hypothetical protein
MKLFTDPTYAISNKKYPARRLDMSVTIATNFTACGFGWNNVLTQMMLLVIKSILLGNWTRW